MEKWVFENKSFQGRAARDDLWISAYSFGVLKDPRFSRWNYFCATKFLPFGIYVVLEWRFLFRRLRKVANNSRRFFFRDSFVKKKTDFQMSWNFRTNLFLHRILRKRSSFNYGTPVETSWDFVEKLIIFYEWTWKFMNFNYRYLRDFPLGSWQMWGNGEDLYAHFRNLSSIKWHNDGVFRIKGEKKAFFPACGYCTSLASKHKLKANSYCEPETSSANSQGLKKTYHIFCDVGLNFVFSTYFRGFLKSGWEILTSRPKSYKEKFFRSAAVRAAVFIREFPI